MQTSTTSSSPLRTVLVADDERDMVDTVALMLETLNCKVLRAYSAEEALNHLDDHADIALLISDIRMPEVDGFDLLRVVRHRFQALPVILMTGLPVTDDDVVPINASILLKPFTYDELDRTLSQKLGAAK
jgi:CheY-like chemotaxis protein